MLFKGDGWIELELEEERRGDSVACCFHTLM
jgi:hypothetical protein